MRDFVLAMIPISSMMAISANDAPFWERIAEKWGIGFIGLGLFLLLANWTVKREDKLQQIRDAREEESQRERINLLSKNNELAEKLITQHKDHSVRLEQIIKDGNKAQEDVGRELKNITRKIRCPIGSNPN